MKRAIVTGCSRGIGRAVTEMLLGEGWRVTGVSRTAADLKHEHFFWLPCDVAMGLESAVRHQRQPLDALIHCAAIRGPYGSFDEVATETWDQVIVTNLIGTADAVRASLPHLKRSDDARILLFSGGGAFDPSPGYSAYAVSKAGVVSLMETLAAELRDTSVTVNCVAPGFIATDIHRGTPFEGKDDGGAAMSNAVACVRHLLSPSTRGLTGRTVSAQHDDWPHITPWIIDRLMDSPAGTRTRHKIQRLEHASRYPGAVLDCPVGATA